MLYISEPEVVRSVVYLCEQLILDSTGNTSTAHGGWYKQDLFGRYRLYSIEANGNNIYKKIISSDTYFIRKIYTEEWTVS